MHPAVRCALLGCIAAAPLLAADGLIKPTRTLSVIDTPHLRAFVPTGQVDALKPLVARAEAIYAAMARDAGYTPTRKLDILFNDDAEDHNGFSFVIPFDLVDIDLAPPPPQSGIFDGGDYLERTLTHEFTHHLSNDRNPVGFRRVMERIFGRVLPFDPLSLVVFYLSTPAHLTQPSFWQEGTAQWSETTYAPPGPWGGRGRDSLSHMVWRLDVASPEGVPPVSTWRLSYPWWPYGNRNYLYGLAYVRYLDAACGQRADIWRLLESQERQWPFRFTTGVSDVLGVDHGVLLEEARRALADEQRQQLARLRAKPVTTLRRLTPPDFRVGLPAWTRDGRLIAALDDPTAPPRYEIVDAAGHRAPTWWHAWSMGDVVSLADGTIAYAGTPAADDPWARSRIFLVQPDGRHGALDGRRLIEPALRARGERRWSVAAVQLVGAGRQRLVVCDVEGRRTWWDWPWNGPRQTAWRAIATQGRAWSPAFRPGSDDIAWVETDAKGSRLVLAPVADPAKRTVLAEVAGRILRPSWSADGTRVFVCCDHSGVSNAYAIDVAKPGELVAVTNTIGGVIACVPSFDGRELALVDFDSHGPFLARLANDPATWPRTVPSIALAWPAPLAANAPAPAGAANSAAAAKPAANAVAAAASNPPSPRDAERDARAARTAHAAAAGAYGNPAIDAALVAAAPTRVVEPGRRELPPSGDGHDLVARPYHGLAELRPLFWTPTTLPVPDGGWGIAGVASDPMQTHLVEASVGVGPVRAQPVGSLGYAYVGGPIDLSVLGWQSERTYANLVEDVNGNQYDYTERVASAEARIGTGLAGLRRRWETYVAAGYADYRVVHSAEAKYSDQTIVSTPPFTGDERYGEAVLAYDDSLFFPTSYAHEDGDTLALSVRRSRFEGRDTVFYRDRALALGTKVISTWPALGQQLVLGGALGASDGPRTLQGAFAIGGALGAGLPRGYNDEVATGRDLVAYSIAYRAALWRSFRGIGSSPAVHRQLVLEGFFDAGRVFDDFSTRGGQWYRSVGAELHDSWEFWLIILNPGVGVARQLDGKEDTVFYVALDFHL